MKLSKWETAILSLAALFLAFTAGWFLRGNTASEPIRVETQRSLEPSAAVISLPEPSAGQVSPPSGGRTEPSAAPAAPSVGTGEKININTADAAALQTLPGIGEKRAESIIADREENGPFRFPEDITRVKGIGEATLANIIDQITTEDTP